MKTLLAIIFLALVVNANAATRYASVTGSGTSPCTTNTEAGACPPATMLSVCVAGDTCIFKNGSGGNYTSATEFTISNSGTSVSQITIKAENPHQATLKVTGSGQNGVFRIRGSYITVQDLIFDGNSGSTPQVLRIDSGSATNLIDVIIEGNIIQNGGAGLRIADAQDCIVRWNLIQHTGYGGRFGEGMYIANASTEDVNGCDLYANKIIDSTNQAVDIKEYAQNITLSYLISEGHLNIGDRTPPSSGANDGVIRNDLLGTGSNNVVTRSIIRDYKNDTGVFGITGGTHVTITDNVVYSRTTDALNSDNFVQFGGSGTGSDGSSVVTGNKVCTPGPSQIAAGSTTGTYTGNVYDQAESVCTDEVAVILAEMALLSGNPQNRWTGPVVASASTVDSTHIDVTFTNNNFPPIKSPDYTQCTVTEDAASRAVSAGAIQGTNVLRLTTAGLSSGTTILVSCSAGAVTDSANILEEDFNVDSSAFSNQSVTNTLAGGATYTFEQVDYRFEKVDGTEAAPVTLPDALEAVKGASFKVRNYLRCNTADCPAVGLIMQYSLNGGTYTTIPDTATSDDIQMYGATNLHGTVITQGSATTQQISSGTFVPGIVIRTSNAIPTFDLNTSEVTELVHIITIATTATVGDQYCFRLADQAGVESMTYTQTGCVTVKAETAGSGM